MKRHNPKTIPKYRIQRRSKGKKANTEQAHREGGPTYIME